MGKIFWTLPKLIERLVETNITAFKAGAES